MITYKPFASNDMEALDELQQAYAQAVPSVKVIPAGFYLSPAFHQGQDVFCAFADNQLIAYAPCYAQLNESSLNLPHRVWVEIKAHPILADPIPVKDHLLDCLVQRARLLVAETNLAGSVRPAQMIFEYLTTETAAVSYVTSRGFAYAESVFAMSRDLIGLPHPLVKPVPASIALKRWKMETESEQVAYITARNTCFPESPIRLEEWQYFMSSPMWPAATMIAAFAGDQLVGATSVYWNDEENQRSGLQVGFTEDIFVLPAWRGYNIAHAMVAEGLAYLKEHSLSKAHLMVRAANEGALGLYRRLGFEVTGESRFYVRNL